MLAKRPLKEFLIYSYETHGCMGANVLKPAIIYNMWLLEGSAIGCKHNMDTLLPFKVCKCVERKTLMSSVNHNFNMTNVKMPWRSVCSSLIQSTESKKSFHKINPSVKSISSFF